MVRYFSVRNEHEELHHCWIAVVNFLNFFILVKLLHLQCFGFVLDFVILLFAIRGLDDSNFRISYLLF